MKKSGLILSVLSFCTASLLIISCGGGGGEGGGGSTVPGFEPVSINTRMTMDQSNSVKTTGLSFFAHEVNATTGTGNIVPLSHNGGDSQDDPPLADAIARMVADQIELHQTYAAAGSASETLSCPNGGSISASLQWTGSQEPTSYCDIVDLHGTMTASSCTDEYGMYMNGTIDVFYGGEFCEPTTLSNTMTNFTYGDGSDKMQTRRLQINASQLSWNYQLPYGSVTGGRFVANGQVVATVDGTSVAVAFNNYTEVLSGSYLEVSGLIYGPCLDGWAEITTVDPILVTGDDCPTAGHLIISGEGDDYDVVINSNGTITVGDTNIGSCEDLSLTCPVP